ncbi:MAG: hypothetical protein R3F14_07670 [Polyangiaceae bacterium]
MQTPKLDPSSAPPARADRRPARFRKVALTAAVFGSLLAWGATGQTEEPTAPEKRTAQNLFDDCLAQEKLGDACSCWRLYQKKYPKAGADNAAQSALTEMKIQKCGEKPAAAAGPKPVAPAYPARTVEDGTCYQGMRLEGAASALLGEITQKCGAPTGMLKMTPVLGGYQTEDDEKEKYLIRLDGDECYRFYVIGDSGISNLQAGFLDPDGRLLVKDVEADRLKVLPPRASFCPEKSGVYTLVISVLDGRGRYVLQGWKRPASAPAPTGKSDHQAVNDALVPGDVPLLGSLSGVRAQASE